MVWNEFPKVFLSLKVGNKIPSVFHFCKMIQNKILSIFIFLEMVLNKIMKFWVFLYFTKWFRTGIPSILYFFRIVQNKITKYQVFLCFFSSIKWNGIPSVFRSSKQTEFRGKESNIRLVREIIFSGKMPTLVQKVTARRGEFWRLLFRN